MYLTIVIISPYVLISFSIYKSEIGVYDCAIFLYSDEILYQLITRCTASEY